MSVSKWAYSERCEGKSCIGDCDLCTQWIDFEDDDALDEEPETEQDGWVTWL